MAEMWILFRGIDSVARGLGRSWTWWIGSAPVQMSGCCLGSALSLIAWWAACIDPSCVCVCVRVCVKNLLGGGIGSGVCFSLFMVSACYWRGRPCFGRGRDRGFVLYFSLFLRVLGWCVCVYACIRAYTHTNYLGTWYEPRCGTDIWKARRIQID